MNTMKNKCYFELTNYPHIYKKVYWGNFLYRPDTDTIDICPTIIENRNKFIEEYNIKNIPTSGVRHKIKEKYITAVMEKTGDIFDHIEYYYTHDKKYICISSPYQNNDEIYSELGWNKINQLYSTGASTYIIFINKK